MMNGRDRFTPDDIAIGDDSLAELRLSQELADNFVVGDETVKIADPRPSETEPNEPKFAPFVSGQEVQVMRGSGPDKGKIEPGWKVILANADGVTVLNPAGTGDKTVSQEELLSWQEVETPLFEVGQRVIVRRGSGEFDPNWLVIDVDVDKRDCSLFNSTENKQMQVSFATLEKWKIESAGPAQSE